MPYVYRQFGNTVEITKYEKEQNKIRVCPPRKRVIVYGARRPDNLKRTRKICVRRLSSALKEFGCPLLLTLTFSGDASDAAFANDSLWRFQVRLRNKYPTSQSLFVPELSPRGRIHFHGLLFNVSLSWGDTRKGGRVISYGSERSTRLLATLWRQGFVDCLKTDGSVRLAFYLAKYITKLKDVTLFNAMHLLRISQGFPREIVLRGEQARWLALRLENKIPTWQYTGQVRFLGEMQKTYYDSSFF